MSGHDERRRLPRRRTRLSAAAVHGPEPTVVACTIRDQTDTGARLLVQTGSSVPDAFHLIELTEGMVRRAQVVWRDDAFVGVTLHDPRSLDEARTAEDRAFADIRHRLIGRGGGR
jgi:hypothetical protein